MSLDVVNAFNVYAKVTKTVTFDSAHYLSEYDGPCRRNHGHRFSLEVTVSGSIDPFTGMVLDFNSLSEILKGVVRTFDHHCLNDAAPELAWRPTAEIMSVFIWECLVHHLPDGVLLQKVRLYETPTSCVEYEGGGRSDRLLEEMKKRSTELLLK